jgi:DNA polymerase I-like protein with 3'-5' exonuclease and polymerase domains
MKIIRNLIVLIIVFVLGVGVGIKLTVDNLYANSNPLVSSIVSLLGSDNKDVESVINELVNEGINVDSQQLKENSDIISEAYSDIENGISKSEFINKYTQAQNIVSEDQLKAIYEIVENKLKKSSD